MPALGRGIGIHLAPRPASGGGVPTPTPSAPYEGTYTISAGKVGADLTDFPTIIDLSIMPAGFWSNVRRDGGNIRVYSGATRLALDLVKINKTAQTGELVFKAPSIASASATAFTVTCEAMDQVQPLPSEAYGRHAVWSDYDGVWMFGLSNRNRASTSYPAAMVGDPTYFDVVAQSGETPGFQGIAVDPDGGGYGITGTNYIGRFASLGATLPAATWSDSNPIASAGLAAPVDHVGDGFIRGGIYYVPMEFYDPEPAVISDRWLVAFDWETGAYLGKASMDHVDINEISGLTYCDRDGLIYATDYRDGSYLYKFSFAWNAGVLSATYEGKLNLTYTYPAAFVPGDQAYQGLVWAHGRFYVADNTAFEVYAVEYDGACAASGLIDVGSIEIEGISVDPQTGALLVMSRVSGTGNPGNVFTLQPKAGPFGTLMGVTVPNSSGINRLVVSGLPSRTTFTLSGSVSFATLATANKAFLSYRNLASAAANRRVTIGHQFSTGKLGVWDSQNASFVQEAGSGNAAATPYRLTAAYTAGGNRRFAKNGVVTSGANAGIPNDLNTLTFFVEDDTLNEWVQGTAGWTYLRPSAVSDAWMAAEYSMESDPVNFGTIS